MSPHACHGLQASSNWLLLQCAAEKAEGFDLGLAHKRAQDKHLFSDLHRNPIPVFLTPGTLDTMLS